MSRDLLAGLLPAGDPFAPFDPQAYRAAFPQLEDAVQTAVDSIPPVSNPDVLPPPPDFVIPVDQPASTIEVPFLLDPGSNTSVPLKDTRVLGGHKIEAVGKVRKRHRRSLAGPLMAVFALLMFAGIAGCLYLLVSGRGLTTDGRLIATGTRADEERGQPDQPAGAAQSADTARPEFDPIMGKLKPSNNDAPPPKFISGMSPAKPEPPTESDAADAKPIEVIPSQPEMPKPAEQNSNEQKTTTGVTPGEEMVVAEMALAESGNKALEELKNALRSGNFETMKGAVEQAGPAMVTEQQKDELAQFVLLVELADYYVEGIRRGAAGRGLGEAFELSPGFTVGVVESSRDKIALKINGRVKSYTFEDLPLVLAHRLAEFAMPPDNLEVVAGRAAYQALWSQATAAHRAEALDWLDRAKQVAGRSDTAAIDTEVLKRAITSLFE